MSGYGQFARVMAGFWLLFQIVILLDFIYDVNEWLLKKVSLQLTKSSGIKIRMSCVQTCNSTVVKNVTVIPGHNALVDAQENVFPFLLVSNKFYTKCMPQ